MGFDLEHPVVPSASPLTERLDSIKRLEDAGAPAIVMHSLFEEQITHESLALHHHTEATAESHAEALSYFPAPEEFVLDSDSYLKLIVQAKENTAIPIVASLNGITPGGWIKYAQRIEQAGADALELNMYYIAADCATTGRDVEADYLETLKAVRAEIKIPVAVKLNPFISALANFASEMVKVGADGLVLFNRFYQPDFDLEKLEVVPNLSLSNANELRIPLRWISILFGEVNCSLAASTGVHTPGDVLKYLMAGADITMTTSALLKHGPEHIGTLVHGIEEWMEEHEYDSVSQMKGSMSKGKVADPAQFERANYVKTLQSYRKT
jgi:dihydroorotate dehydrogenase (fumarate)